MTRICFIDELFKFAIIRDGILCGIVEFGFFYDNRLRWPDKIYWVKDIFELQKKFLLSGIERVKK